MNFKTEKKELIKLIDKSRGLLKGLDQDSSMSEYFKTQREHELASLIDLLKSDLVELIKFEIEQNEKGA